jgi:hypothetical protein
MHGSNQHAHYPSRFVAHGVVYLGSASDEGRADLDSLIAQVATIRTARAWLNRENLCEILERKQINVVSALLRQRCTNVMRSKVELMKAVARMIRKNFNGIIA